MKSTKKIISILCSIIITLSLTACNIGGKNVNSPDYINSIKFKDFTKDISADRIYSTIEKLSAKDDARLTGFEGEKEAATYISNEFKEIGLSVEEQEFPVSTFKCDFVEVKLDSPTSKVIGSRHLFYSKETPKGGISAEVVNGYKGKKGDLEKANVDGKLVLIQCGEERLKYQVERAANLGALGVIFFDLESEDIFIGTLVKASKIPSVSISKADAKSLISTINTGKKVKATIKVDSVNKDSTSKNIIATLKSKKKNAKTIIVGAHYDGVNTPAANDNASGISTILETARILSKKKLDCNIKFIAFGAEEIGLVGSYHYVQSLGGEDLVNTIAMINADMVGIGDTFSVYTAYDFKRSLTADLASSCMNYFKYPYFRQQSDRSDHVPFEAVGIPSVFLFCGPSDNYHTDDDTADKINKQNLTNACNVVTSLCYEISKNQKMFSE